MKLIFIYGPPAVGKFTVAQELKKICDYRLFHNHLTLDLAESIFEWGTFDFWKLVRKLRLEVISAITKTQCPGLIFTFVYEGTKTEDNFINKLVNCVIRQNGEVYFIQLIASQNILKKRVLKPSRRAYSKISDIATLTAALRRNKNNNPININPHFRIDNSKYSAKNIALKIAKFISK